MFDDDLKVVMFMLMVAAMFLLARGLSAKAPRAEQPYRPPPEPERNIELPQPAREPGSHYDPAINPDLVIVQYNFGTFHADVGPPDPDEFYDELHFQAYNRKDGYRFTGSLMVATPRGLALELKQSGAAYVEGDGAIIVPRYDRMTILEALVERHTDPAELKVRREQQRVYHHHAQRIIEG